MTSLIPPSGHKITLSDLFKKEVSNSFIDSGYLFNSGTSSLYFLISNLKIPLNSKIVIPAYTCPTVAAAVIKAGHQPVLCDINLSDLGYDKNELKQKIKLFKPAAVICVNLFGILESIPDIDIPIILDNAQADPFNTNFNVSGIIHSFGRGKPINSLSGGIAIINKKNDFEYPEKIYAKIKKNHLSKELKYLLNVIAFMIFFNPKFYKLLYHIQFLNLGKTIYYPNFEINKIYALNKKLIFNIFLRYDSIYKMRKEQCKIYDEIFMHFKEKVQFFPEKSFYRYPVILKISDLKEMLILEFQKKGLGAFPLYPVTLNRQHILKDILKDSNTYPNASYITKNLFTLPVNEFIIKDSFNDTYEIFSKYF